MVTKPSEVLTSKEMSVVNELRDYIKSGENMYSSQKTDLLNLINETLTDKHVLLKSQIDQLIDNKFDKFKSFYTPPPQTNSGDNINTMLKLLEGKLGHGQPVHEKVTVPEPAKVEGKKRGKYILITPNLWSELRLEFPDLPESLNSKAYIKDNEYFIKLKSNFIKVDASGVARIVNYYLKNPISYTF